MYNSVVSGRGCFAGRTVWISLIMALVALCLGGCGSCLGKKPSETGTPHVQTPAAPLSAPAIQTPASPLSAVSISTDGGGEAEEEAILETPESPVVYDAELLLNINPGMSYEEVKEMLGDPGKIIAGNDAENSVYRWSTGGISFMGRFENGTLIRKSIVSPDSREAAMDENRVQFDRELFAMIVPGMSFEEVLSIIGMDAQPLSSGSNNVNLYKWTDSNGSSITARFENKVLVRKSGMIMEAEKGDTPKAGEEETAAEDDAAKVYEESPGDKSIPSREETAPAPDALQIAPGPPAQSPRVHIAGAKRREREIAEDPSPYAGRSYRPEVKLPDFTRKLRAGSYEIHIHNTTTSRARVAIISEEGGLELSVAPTAHASTRVRRGTYELYFIYDDAPYTLHQGQRIPVEELLTDFVVSLFDDSSKVDLL